MSGVLFGVLCFVAGRFTAPHNSARVVSEPAVLPASSATNATVSSAKTGVAPSNESPMQPNAALPAAWDEKQWQQILSQAGSPARSRALAALMESLAGVDPDRAMSLARAEENLKLRETLVQSALHGWARTSPTNAARWALALPDSNERDRALATVFAGAIAADPEAAMRFGTSLIQQNPAEASGYGSTLIEALCAAGNFEVAARMAAGGGNETRSGWMANAYSRWAEFQPEQAARAASAIKDADLRNEALHGIVGGWAEADPVALVQFVTQLPPDNERGALLSQALVRWAKQDPEGASGWINGNEARPELDEGVAAVATMDSLKPDVAIGWAESVVDPKLRSETLVTVIRNWLTVDLSAARHYFETTRNLLPADRQELVEVFAAFGNDAARP